jgi:hypothetical protein
VSPTSWSVNVKVYTTVPFAVFSGTLTVVLDEMMGASFTFNIVMEMYSSAVSVAFAALAACTIRVNVVVQVSKSTLALPVAHSAVPINVNCSDKKNKQWVLGSHEIRETNKSTTKRSRPKRPADRFYENAGINCGEPTHIPCLWTALKCVQYEISARLARRRQIQQQHAPCILGDSNGDEICVERDLSPSAQDSSCPNHDAEDTLCGDGRHYEEASSQTARNGDGGKGVMDVVLNGISRMQWRDECVTAAFAASDGILSVCDLPKSLHIMVGSVWVKEGKS